MKMISKGNATQQCVHLTSGNLRVLQALSSSKRIPALKANPSPARQQVTRAVGRLSDIVKIH